MQMTQPNLPRNNKFFHKDLFRIYKLHRVLIAEVALIILATTLAPVFESGHPGARITRMSEALWWAVVTATTTGYGDYVPVTLGGRLIGTVLMFSGFALYSVAVGTFVLFINRHLSRRNWHKTQLKLDTLTKQIDQLEKQVEFLVKSQVKK